MCIFCRVHQLCDLGVYIYILDIQTLPLSKMFPYRLFIQLQWTLSISNSQGTGKFVRDRESSR